MLKNQTRICNTLFNAVQISSREIGVDIDYHGVLFNQKNEIMLFIAYEKCYYSANFKNTYKNYTALFFAAKSKINDIIQRF